MGVPALKKIFLLSLGCPRNLTDSEVLLASLQKEGFSIVDEAEGADIATVNTCGFIEDAKKESIDAIMALADLKKQGAISRIIVCGCLSQRYPNELIEEVGEIDGIFGTSDLAVLPGMIETIMDGQKIRHVSADPDPLRAEPLDRRLLTPEHYAYLKIQEGCSNRCSYCVIPSLKGAHKSRTVDSVLREAESLKRSYGVKELILIGQDITSFGEDRGSSPELASLVRKLSPVMEDGWVRLLYAHPARFSDELIDVIAGTPNVCKYVDLPIQHINNRILGMMNRAVTRKDIERLIHKVRERIEGVTIRTSIIVGFPGETDEEFGELMQFLKDTRFERLGCFTYSREEGTPAAGFEGHLPEEVKKERFDAVMGQQQEISLENNLSLVGKTLKVLVDEASSARGGHFVGRGEMDAPEVDGVVYISGDAKPAEFSRVRITGSYEYDLVGEAE